MPVTATGFHHRWNVGPIGKHLMGLSDGQGGVKRRGVPALQVHRGLAIDFRPPVCGSR